MMKTKFIFLIILLSAINTSLFADAREKSLPIYSQIFDPERDVFKDGAAAVKLASQTNRRILIDLGGDWCKWCHKMDDFFAANPEVKQRLHETFVLLKVNVSNENENSEFLKVFPRPLGYPHMYVSEKNGSVLWSQDTAEFIKDGKYNKQAFMDFFQRWQITPEQVTQ